MPKRSTRSYSFSIFTTVPPLGQWHPVAMTPWRSWRALSAAVVSWWTRWQPSMIHAALSAGVDLADIAEATGLDVSEVVQRWRRWVDAQTRLDIGGRPAVDPAEVRVIERRLALGVIR